MTPEELKQIEARLDAAGDWRAMKTGERACLYIGHCCHATLWHKEKDANDDFIAHAPQDVADLIAEVKRLSDPWYESNGNPPDSKPAEPYSEEKFNRMLSKIKSATIRDKEGE
jgi:hypothetical protein